MPDPTPVANTAADLLNKTLITAEDDQVITGDKSFVRAPASPFSVQAGSAKVDNLDADMLDGSHLQAILDLITGATGGGGGGGGGTPPPIVGGLGSQAFTLTHADILALPTTPFTLAVPATGARLLFIGCALFAKNITAYTGLSDPATLFIQHEADRVSDRLVNDAGQALTGLTSLFDDHVDGTMCWLMPRREIDAVYGLVPVTRWATPNISLQLALNNAAGNLTGGDTANVLNVVTFYRQFAP